MGAKALKMRIERKISGRRSLCSGHSYLSNIIFNPCVLFCTSTTDVTPAASSVQAALRHIGGFT